MVQKIQFKSAYNIIPLQAVSQANAFTSQLASEPPPKAVAAFLNTQLDKAVPADKWDDFRRAVEWLKQHKNRPASAINSDEAFGMEAVGLLSKTDMIYDEIFTAYRNTLKSFDTDKSNNNDNLPGSTTPVLSGLEISRQLSKYANDDAVKNALKAVGSDVPATAELLKKKKLQVNTYLYAYDYLNSRLQEDLKFLGELKEMWGILGRP